MIAEQVALCRLFLSVCKWRQKEKRTGPSLPFLSISCFFQIIVSIESELVGLARAKTCTDAWKNYRYVFRHFLFLEFAPLLSRASVQITCINSLTLNAVVQRICPLNGRRHTGASCCFLSCDNVCAFRHLCESLQMEKSWKQDTLRSSEIPILIFLFFF